MEEDDEEVLGRHREVGHFCTSYCRMGSLSVPSPDGGEKLTIGFQACEKCTRGPADEILQTALARKKKGTKSKRKEDDDLISDEELAFQLEGWLEVSGSSVIQRAQTSRSDIS